MAARGLPPRKPYSGAQPDFQNSSPYSTIIRRNSGRLAVLHQATLCGVPGRRGRDGPVADQSEVERRVHPDGAEREAIRPAHEQVQDGAVRDHEPHPVAPDQHLLEGVEAAGGAEGALQPHGRRACRGRSGGRLAPGRRRARGARAPRGRRWASRSPPGRPTSAARTCPRHARASAGPGRTGRRRALQAAASTTGGLSAKRRRASGAATPAASAAAAAARMRADRRKRASISGARRPPGAPARPRRARPGRPAA